jgi:NADH-quinone oxidoreductase subunit N
MHSANFISPFLIGITSIISIFFGVFAKDRLAKIISILLTFTSLIFALFLSFGGMLNSIQSNSLNFSLIIGFFCQLIITISALASVIIFANDNRENIKRFESYPIIALACSGGIFAIFSYNMIGTYLGIELMSISGYILATLNREDKISNESSMKYFLMGAVSSCILIYGISLIYGFSGGNLLMENLFYNIVSQNNVGLILGFILFLFGLFFKTTSFPFHFWASDVYRGINSSSLSFISITPKLVSFFVICKIFIFKIPNIEGAFEVFTPIITALAGISMIIGAVGALKQENIKKILAYSGIVNMGFVLSLFAVKPSTSIFIYYFLIYTFIIIGIFAVISALQKNSLYSGSIKNLQGLAHSNPYLSFALAIFMFSSAGIPPLAGFFIKYSVLANLIKQGNYILPVVGILSSAIASFYYLKVVKAMYFENQDSEFANNSKSKIHFSIKFLIGLSLMVNILLVVFANFIFAIS